MRKGQSHGWCNGTETRVTWRTRKGWRRQGSRHYEKGKSYEGKLGEGGGFFTLKSSTISVKNRKFMAKRNFARKINVRWRSVQRFLARWNSRGPSLLAARQDVYGCCPTQEGVDFLNPQPTMPFCCCVHLIADLKFDLWGDSGSWNGISMVIIYTASSKQWEKRSFNSGANWFKVSRCTSQLLPV